MTTVNLINPKKNAIFFGDTVEAVARVMESWGWKVFPREVSGQHQADIEILFGADRYDRWERLPGCTYGLWNMEQLNTPSRLADFEHIVDLIDFALDLSTKNIGILKEKHRTTIVHCPVGYHPYFDSSNINVRLKKYDVMFFGLMTPRRIEIVERLKKVCKAFPTEFLWGTGRARQIAKTKINLNMHVTENDFPEYLRFVMLFLSSKRFCLTERMGECGQFIDGTHLVYMDKDNVESQVQELLADNVRRDQIAEQGYEFVKNEFRLDQLMDKAFRELGFK